MSENKCAVAGTWPYGWMVATGIWTFVIDCTASAAAVEIDAMAARPPGQGEGCRPGMKMFDQPFFHQPSGDQFRILLEGKFIDQLHTHQIGSFDFNGQTAAGSGTMATKLQRELCPGPGVVEIGVLAWKTGHDRVV